MNNTMLIRQIRQRRNLPDDLPLRLVNETMDIQIGATSICSVNDFEFFDWRLWSESEMFSAFVHENDREALSALILLLSDPDRSRSAALNLADCADHKRFGSADALRAQRAIAKLPGAQKRDFAVCRLGSLVNEIVDRHS